jgi:hypothetical protein
MKYRRPRRYSWRVCGGIGKVKELFVKEIRLKRIALRLTAEDVDAILNIQATKLPYVGQIEGSPNLFTIEFHQHWTIKRLDSPEVYDRLFDITGEFVNAEIDKFLSEGRNLDDTIADLKRSGATISGTLYHEDEDEHFERVLEGRPVKQFAPNMIPPIEYARIHIYTCIMDELRSSDGRSRSIFLSIIVLLTILAILFLVISSYWK